MEEGKPHLSIAILLATVLGLGAAIWTFDHAGLGEVLSTATRMGFGGFALFCLYSFGVFFVLGGAWWVAAPGQKVTRIVVFSWGRMVREGVADLLPFSHLGGIIAGCRVVIQRKVEAQLAYAALVVDLTTEMASQLVFTLISMATLVLLLVDGARLQSLQPVLLAGIATMLVSVVGLLLLQHRMLDLAGRLAGMFLPGAVAAMQGVRARLEEIYARRGRVLGAFLLNLLAWYLSATGGWIALRLMGEPVELVRVLTLESLIFAVRSAAFFLPGAIGVQEAGYALLGPVLGISPATGLALSLAKRARDLALGGSFLLIWQAQEARALLGRRKPA